MLKKTFILGLLPAILVILSCGLAQAAIQLSCGLAQATTFTVATFGDPSLISTNPLFTVDFRHKQMKLTGGWPDSQIGLTLEIPYSGYTIANGNAFTNAWFEMSEVEIMHAHRHRHRTFSKTGPGEINFYRDGDSENPLVAIDFESGSVSRYGFGADEIFVANNVTITGSEITGTFSEEMFSFSFANLARLPGSTNWNNGFTATAAFTSSASLSESAVPEPATVGLLGLGALSLLRRKRSKA
jgi:hypothetical protein